MIANQPCSAPGCPQPAMAKLEGRSLCPAHFIVTSYHRLEESAERLRDPTFSGTTSEALRDFTEECIRQSADISQTAESLDNLSRARLLDILLWAAEINTRLRRGPRHPVAVPILLRSEKPGRLWQEKTQTQMLSRRGAMVECAHAVEEGEILHVTRLDAGRQARARVVWRWRKGASGSVIGLEFADADNFWDLD